MPSFLSSGTFWAAAGVIATLIGLVLTPFIQSSTGRGLVWRCTKPRPLADAAIGEDDKAVQAFRSLGDSLLKPHVLELVIAGTGRRDIPSEAFDLQRPIIVDVNGLIVATFLRGRPGSYRPPKSKIYGTKFELGPGLISSWQYLSYMILIEGASAKVTVQTSLTDVRVWNSESYSLRDRRLRLFLRRSLYYVALAAFIGALAGIVFPQIYPKATTFNTVVLAAAVFDVVFIVGLIMAWQSMSTVLKREGVHLSLCVSEEERDIVSRQDGASSS